MTFLIDVEELKPGLIIFRRSDVQHRRWSCRIKIPESDRYKTLALKTEYVHEAKEIAYDHDAELRFKLKHGIPVFERSFAQVAQEYSDKEKERAEAGQITYHRWRVLESCIRIHLKPFLDTYQIAMIGPDRWDEYPIWRQKNGRGRTGGRVSDATIRYEMSTLKAIMYFAAAKRYIREDQAFKDSLPASKARREEFNPQEYRTLYTFARKWMKETRNPRVTWVRTVAHNFMLTMTNTGMRPSEARNLRWKDISLFTDSQRREFVRMSVRGKGKYRTLVAAKSVWTYLQRIRKLSKATAPDDLVFTNEDGSAPRTLYHGAITSLLVESKLIRTPSGSYRSTYCFRHTYATFRLMQGVDSYILANQMGTSVQMIEKYYGHVEPVKNADLILQGVPGWEPVGTDIADRSPPRTRPNRDDSGHSRRDRKGRIQRPGEPPSF